MGLEPITFELEVDDPLRHEGTALVSGSVINELSYWKYFTAS